MAIFAYFLIVDP